MSSGGGGINVQIDVQLNSVRADLLRIAGQVDEFREPLNNSSTYMEQSIGRRFRTGGGSRPWSLLAASTIAMHPHRAGGKPLNDTGRLKMSVTAGASKRIGGKQLKYGFGGGVSYAEVHNNGGGHIPQREFLYFDTQDEAKVRRIFNDYVRRVTNV